MAFTDIEKNNVEMSKKQQALEALEQGSTFSAAHIKTVAVAGSGFLTDSYDNFIINLIVPMIGILYYATPGSLNGAVVKPTYKIDGLASGWLKAASSYGNLVGQLTFGIVGDLIGRKAIYAISLALLIIGALGSSLAAQPLQGLGIVGVLIIWRFILGVGVGGDYPVSSVMTSEFATTKNRGTLIALVFSMQGIGILMGAGMACLALVVMKASILSNVQNLDYVWRFLAGFGAVPALLAIYYRLKISESPRYTMNVEGKVDQAVADAQNFIADSQYKDVEEVAKVSAMKAYRGKFVKHFSQWKNLKVLIACSMCWFLLDICYYGTNLNTSIILTAINYSSKPSANAADSFQSVWLTCLGQLIIAICGNVPGYYFAVFFIDRMGRKSMQIMGFAMLVLSFGALGIFYNWFKANTTYFLIVYSIAQFFNNFGPNTTTFIYPAEVFPTAVRSSAHGISAASGKLGAIIAAQAFTLVVDIGGKTGDNTFMGGTLIIFAGLSLLGLLFTFLLPETMGKSLEELSDEEELQ